jgi:hypothetical protein
MKSQMAYALLAVATLAAAGCGGGGRGGEPPPAVNPPPSSTPPPATLISFTNFVLEQIAATDDTVEPIEVNDLDWEFDENETAYDNVL